MLERLKVRHSQHDEDQNKGVTAGQLQHVFRTYFVLIATSILIMGFVSRNLFQVFLPTELYSDPEHEILVTMLVLGILLSLSQLFRGWFASYRGYLKGLRELLASGSRRMIVALCLFAAVGEECFFRGVIQHHLGLGATCCVVLVLYSLATLRISAWSVFGFLQSLLLGVAFIELKTLYPVIAIHFTLNLALLLWPRLRQTSQ